MELFRDLLKKNNMFPWSATLQSAFKSARQSITEKVLARVRTFVLCCVDRWSPIYTGSRFCSLAESKYSELRWNSWVSSCHCRRQGSGLCAVHISCSSLTTSLLLAWSRQSTLNQWGTPGCCACWRGCWGRYRHLVNLKGKVPTGLIMSKKWRLQKWQN